MRDPVRDEAAREQLDELGLMHFIDVRATVRQLLERLGPEHRSAFAAAVAQRLLHDHQCGPDGDPQVLAWCGAIDAVWRSLAGDAGATREVGAAVGHLYLGPHYWQARHDDPADLVDHTVMASLYACECRLHGCLEMACWAGWRGFDAATVHAAHDDTWPHRRPVGISAYVWELAHPAVQAELGRQLTDVELLSDRGAALTGRPDEAGRLLDRLRLGAAA